MPKDNSLRPPKFLTLVQREIVLLMNDDRTGLAIQIYLLLLAISDFKTGQIYTSYDYLQEMTTPPRREKGGRRGAASKDQIRRVIARLIEYGLVKRNAEENAAQGALRLRVRKLEKTKTS